MEIWFIFLAVNSATIEFLWFRQRKPTTLLISQSLTVSGFTQERFSVILITVIRFPIKFILRISTSILLSWNNDTWSWQSAYVLCVYFYGFYSVFSLSMVSLYGASGIAIHFRLALHQVAFWLFPLQKHETVIVSL